MRSNASNNCQKTENRLHVKRLSYCLMAQQAEFRRGRTMILSHGYSQRGSWRL